MYRTLVRSIVKYFAETMITMKEGETLRIQEIVIIMGAIIFEEQGYWEQ